LPLAEALLDLQRLTEQLRRECPWDRAQTARTIVPHTVEEAYEVADAAVCDDPAALVDEIGDLLFQVYFLALLLSEEGAGGLEEVARGVHDKLVRRHPHVFGGDQLETAGAVRVSWDRIKSKEGRNGLFDSIPSSLPALSQARTVQRRAAGVGFEYPDVAGAVADLDDELAELKAELESTPVPAPEQPPDERQAAELGDLLFAAVNVARRVNADPELELRRATARFVARVEKAAELASRDGGRFAELSLSDQDRFFDLAKELE